ncbi:hypothetical protein HK105_204075 [Polyrhizophydium stewartii]|uniref:Arrestin-like N-terminal domain-containing protein n=1 Tax=Polyrhizophydium stewartii TaxID=2732419 RepID=A0ABR4NA30_9FUNG
MNGYAAHASYMFSTGRAGARSGGSSRMMLMMPMPDERAAEAAESPPAASPPPPAPASPPPPPPSPPSVQVPLPAEPPAGHAPAPAPLPASSPLQRPASLASLGVRRPSSSLAAPAPSSRSVRSVRSARSVASDAASSTVRSSDVESLSPAAAAAAAAALAVAAGAAAQTVADLPPEFEDLQVSLSSPTVTFRGLHSVLHNDTATLQGHVYVLFGRPPRGLRSVRVRAVGEERVHAFSERSRPSRPRGIFEHLVFLERIVTVWEPTPHELEITRSRELRFRIDLPGDICPATCATAEGSIAYTLEVLLDMVPEHSAADASGPRTPAAASTAASTSAPASAPAAGPLFAAPGTRGVITKRLSALTIGRLGSSSSRAAATAALAAAVHSTTPPAPLATGTEPAMVSSPTEADQASSSDANVGAEPDFVRGEDGDGDEGAAGIAPAKRLTITLTPPSHTDIAGAAAESETSSTAAEATAVPLTAPGTPPGASAGSARGSPLRRSVHAQDPPPDSPVTQAQAPAVAGGAAATTQGLARAFAKLSGIGGHKTQQTEALLVAVVDWRVQRLPTLAEMKQYTEAVMISRLQVNCFATGARILLAHEAEPFNWITVTPCRISVHLVGAIGTIVVERIVVSLVERTLLSGRKRSLASTLRPGFKSYERDRNVLGQRVLQDDAIGPSVLLDLYDLSSAETLNQAAQGTHVGVSHHIALEIHCLKRVQPVHMEIPVMLSFT